ncbi:MAG: thioredoxin domain-containing protein [Thermoleophilia bacterium]
MARILRTLTPLALALVAAVSLAACGGGDSSSAPAAPPAGESQQGAAPDQFTELDGIPQDGAILGDPNAPVTLVEYGDMQCPFCAEWAEKALPSVIDEYVATGKVQLRFNGMAFIGPDSVTALQAINAAGLQDRMWQMVELLYLNQGGENAGWVTEELLRRLGQLVPGLDVDRMIADMGSDEVKQLVDASIADAAQNGIESTPSFRAGKTDGTLEVVEIDSLEADGITPTLDELLAG